MRRIGLAVVLGVSLITPLRSEAQLAGKVYRVGILGESAADPSEARLWQTFRSGLKERGWIEGNTNAADLAGKRLELLGEIVPKLKRAAVLWHPANPTNPIQLKGAQIAARTLGVQLEPVSVQEPNDFDSASKAVRGTDGLLLLESPFFTTHRARLAELAAQSRRPAIYGQREYAEVGGLISYGYALSRLVQGCSPVCGQDLERR
jgi:ABC-type uncharacterized transport system substrate-binding protein